MIAHRTRRERRLLSPVMLVLGLPLRQQLAERFEREVAPFPRTRLSAPAGILNRVPVAAEQSRRTSR